jgi:transcriptional regulator with XRE-family HTH domain
MTADLSSAIGDRVRQERQSPHWTLDQLAETAGMSRRMVVNVEQGAANPSVGTLLRISDALGIGLPALVQPPQPRPVKVTRRGEGAVLWTGSAGPSLPSLSETPSGLVCRAVETRNK